MAQSAAERKIKRLESEVKRLKEKIKEQDELLRGKDSELHSERTWRRNFQSLLKEVVMEDTVQDRGYW